MTAATHQPAEPQKTAADQMNGCDALGQKKHFLVSRVIQPDLPADPVESMEIEAVLSKVTQFIAGENCKTTAFGGRVGFDDEAL